MSELSRWTGERIKALFGAKKSRLSYQAASVLLL